MMRRTAITNVDSIQRVPACCAYQLKFRYKLAHRPRRTSQPTDAVCARLSESSGTRLRIEDLHPTTVVSPDSHQKLTTEPERSGGRVPAGFRMDRQRRWRSKFHLRRDVRMVASLRHHSPLKRMASKVAPRLEPAASPNPRTSKDASTITLSTTTAGHSASHGFSRSAGRTATADPCWLGGVARPRHEPARA